MAKGVCCSNYVFSTLICCFVVQLYLTLCDPTDCSLPGPSVQGISQARMLEWGAKSFLLTYLESDRSLTRAFVTCQASCSEHLLTSSTDCSSHDGTLPILTVTGDLICIKSVLWKNQLLRLIAVMIKSKSIHLSTA